MEVTGTIHSIQEIEQLFIKSMPYKVTHDGHFALDKFDPQKSASNIPAQSEAYERSYQLFPFGRKQLWEERVNTRFFYDKRHGTGTWKISSRGMHILGMELKGMLTGVKVGKAELPLGDTVHIRGHT